MGIGPEIVSIIMNLNSEATVAVKIHSKTTQLVPIAQWMLQGNTLSDVHLWLEIGVHQEEGDKKGINKSSLWNIDSILLWGYRRDRQMACQYVRHSHGVIFLCFQWECEKVVWCLSIEFYERKEKKCVRGVAELIKYLVGCQISIQMSSNALILIYNKHLLKSKVI